MLVTQNTVEINGKTMTGGYIVIGTRSYHFIPDGIEYDKQSIITSDEVLRLHALPKKIAIYGVGAFSLKRQAPLPQAVKKSLL